MTESQELAELAREHFAQALREGLSRYMAVYRASVATGLTMSQVGLLLHPRGTKHKPKVIVKTATD